MNKTGFWVFNKYHDLFNNDCISTMIVFSRIFESNYFDAVRFFSDFFEYMKSAHDFEVSFWLFCIFFKNSLQHMFKKIIIKEIIFKYNMFDHFYSRLYDVTLLDTIVDTSKIQNYQKQSQFWIFIHRKRES